MARRMIVYTLILGVVISTAGMLLLIRTSTMPPTHSQLLFSDDFHGADLDRSKWGTCYPWFKTAGCTNHGNPELEWYLPQQVSVQRGVLHLTTQRSPVDGFDAQGHAKTFPYWSGMVTTAGHFDFTYGRVEFQARAPRGRGLWPALWLVPADGSTRPEIDVMEAYGEDIWQVFLSYHGSRNYTSQRVAFVNDISSGWHSYVLDWRPDSVIWYVDGRRWFTVDQSVPHKPMYLIANLAVSGMSPHEPDGSTPDHARFDIASVRVWGP